MATLDQGVLPRALTLHTPAKINLTLRVLGRRTDGFHELESLVVGAGIFDSLVILPVETGELCLACDEPGIGARDNLVRRAFDAFVDRVGAAPVGTRIALAKKIPIGAGLGGGSADAAATLRICNEIWGAGLADSELADIGASIGSDVPLFFHLPCAVMRGRGERVERTSLCWKGWALLITPPFSISTREVYGLWREGDSAPDRPPFDELSTCSRADEFSAHLFNELEPALFRARPDLAGLKQEMERLLDRSIRVTGSGSTMFLLFDDYKLAVLAAKNVTQRFPGVVAAVVDTPVAMRDPEPQE